MALVIAVTRVKNTSKFLSMRREEYDKELGEIAAAEEKEQGGEAGTSQQQPYTPKRKVMDMVGYSNPEKRAAAEAQKKVEELGKNDRFINIVKMLVQSDENIKLVLANLTGAAIDVIYEEVNKDDPDSDSVGAKTFHNR